MESVIVRNIQDLEKIGNDTKEIEFINYNEDYSFCSQLNISSVTFTKMNVFLDILSKNIKRLSLYDCEFDDNLLNEFRNLEYLEITNSCVDVNKILFLNKLKSINVSFSSVVDGFKFSQFKLLEEVILDDTNIENLDFLLSISTLKRVIINNEMMDKFNSLFCDLMDRGVIVCNVMGGVFNEV